MSYHILMKSREKVIADDYGRIILFTVITKARIFYIEKKLTGGDGVISKATLLRQLKPETEIVLDPDPKKDDWEESVIRVVDLKE